MSNQVEQSLAEWVDEIADQYEKAWQGVHPPRLADFLGDANGQRRDALRTELLKIDLAYRAKLDAHRDPADYRDDLQELAGAPAPDPAASTLRPGEARLPSANKIWPRIPGYEILGA